MAKDRPGASPAGWQRVDQYRPTAIEPVFRLGYRPELDGVRAIAVLAVMLWHPYIIGTGADEPLAHILVRPLLGGGIFGVDIFFVLSGFLITTLLLQEHHRTGRIDLRSFYLRRVLRLFPPLLVVLLACTAYVLAFAPPGLQFGFRTIAMSGFYVANFGMMRTVAGLGMLSHTWSLAVEEQFYTLWPLALIGLLKLPRRVVLPLVCMAIAAVFMLRGWCFVTARSMATQLFASYSLPTRADGLFAGAAVALIACWGWFPKSPQGQQLLRAIGPGAAVGLLLLIMSPVRNQLFGNILVSLMTAGLIAGLIAQPPAWLLAGLRWPPLVWVGRISYGLYLYHFPIYCLTPAVIASFVPRYLGSAALLLFAVGATFAVAAASFYLIEQRFLALKHVLAPRDRMRLEMA